MLVDLGVPLVHWVSFHFAPRFDIALAKDKRGAKVPVSHDPVDPSTFIPLLWRFWRSKNNDFGFKDFVKLKQEKRKQAMRSGSPGRQTNRQVDRKTFRQTDRQADR